MDDQTTGTVAPEPAENTQAKPTRAQIGAVTLKMRREAEAEARVLNELKGALRGINNVQNSLSNVLTSKQGDVLAALAFARGSSGDERSKTLAQAMKNVDDLNFLCGELNNLVIAQAVRDTKL